MEYIIFYGIICILLLGIFSLYITFKVIYIVGDSVTENQEKLSRQINNIKIKNIDISDYERIIIDNIIATLVKLEEAKCISYKTEIHFLNKIKEL